jgi:2,3-bisphosphoglycerate-independent phosphoglycerate mutase
MIGKYAILVGDGMADKPIAELDNKTPLEYASTPNMDALARMGIVGRVATVPAGFSPGSDVANLSLLGYDPLEFYSGRAPIEAAGLGIPMTSDDTAFRCNLVEIDNGTMIDYSAGHISTDESAIIINELQKALGTDTVKFYSGISYRHILVIKFFPDGLKCTPPHDITDQKVISHMPIGTGDTIVIELMERAKNEISRIYSEILRKNILATDIWLWGQGKALALPKIHDLYGLSGSVISAVDLVRGLGVLAGLQVRIVDGATGYLGTNYAGKVAAAQKALETENFVYLHVEAPDETSHQGDLQKKIQAIEEFDKYVVGEMRAYQHIHPELKILVAPDHATPVSLKTHSSEPVPFIMCGRDIQSDNSTEYSEKSSAGKKIYTGPMLFESFIRGF